jgi:hypothetical protein
MFHLEGEARDMWRGTFVKPRGVAGIGTAAGRADAWFGYRRQQATTDLKFYRWAGNGRARRPASPSTLEAHRPDLYDAISRGTMAHIKILV